MATEALDLCGLKCPQPAMKVVTRLLSMKKGDILEATPDCETFEADIRRLCERWQKTLLSVRKERTKQTVQIRA